jgi:LysM domain
MLNFVAPRTVNVPRTGPSVEEQIPLAKHPMADSMYVVHKVQPSDTLDRLCILYDVSKDMIRKANQFTGDEIFMKKELVIPHSAGPIFRQGTVAP